MLKSFPTYVLVRLYFIGQLSPILIITLHYFYLIEILWVPKEPPTTNPMIYIKLIFFLLKHKDQ